LIADWTEARQEKSGVSHCPDGPNLEGRHIFYEIQNAWRRGSRYTRVSHLLFLFIVISITFQDEKGPIEESTVEKEGKENGR
jgi:hypothetical protein